MLVDLRNLGCFFTECSKIEIPFFQRPYVWEKEQWKRFLDDIKVIVEDDNENDYFFGTVILKREKSKVLKLNNEEVTFKLIDGQQRLTTVNIFFKVLYLMKNKNECFDQLFRTSAKNGNDLIIKHNYRDSEYFNYILGLDELKELDKEKSNIYAAYEYFRKKLKELNFEEFEKLDGDRIKDKISFVVIDLEKEDEQQIVDTINSLGVRLTTAELLKNYFFNNPEEKNDFHEYWENVFDEKADRVFWNKKIKNGSISREIIDLFFYAFLQIKSQSEELKVSFTDKREFSRVDKLFSSYKRFVDKYYIKDNKKPDLFKEIKDYADLFKSNLKIGFKSKSKFVGESLPSSNGIHRINNIIWGLEQTTLIPYVLYLLKNVKFGKIEPEEGNKIFGLLESYIMRRMIVRANNKGYNRLFEQLIANEINSQEKLSEYLSKDTLNRMPSDEEVKNGFRTSRLTNANALGILYMLESKIRESGRHSTQLLGMGEYSLEHLMPREWDEKTWPFPENFKESEKDRKYRDDKLLTLGNLAIITQPLNSSIRNSSWDMKKKGKNNNGLEAYAWGLETLKECLKKNVWNEDNIEKRAVELYEKAIRAWPDK